MKPLSRKKRSGYLIVLIVIFIIAAPLLILYASGYRLGETLRFLPTGGLYVTTAQSGIEIYINDELIRETSLWQKNILIQNLKPQEYRVKVVKDGYQEWSKTLQVFAEIVTEAHTFMLPTEIEIEEILPVIVETPNSTSTGTAIERGRENPEYLAVTELFKKPITKTTTSKVATTTRDVKILRKLSVENVGGRLEVEWIGEPDSQPVYFCLENVCEDRIIIEPKSRLISFDFFPGREDLIILGLESGIYVTEVDNRGGQNVQKIIEGLNIDFKVMNGDKIYLKIDKKYFSVSL